MNYKYKVRCKICGDILEAYIPVKKEIKCNSGNIGLYSDYIAYDYNHLGLNRDECYEDLNKENLNIVEIKEYYNKVENEINNK